MRRALVLGLSVLTSCRDEPSPQRQSPGMAAQSPCGQKIFEGARFTVCRSDGVEIQIRSGFRSFADLEHALGALSPRVAFAMNAGMYDRQGRPVGLMIEAGKSVHKINLNRGR